MKYGIRLTKSDGSVLYCHSTRSLQGYFSEDTDGIALFVQEPSAVKALMVLRKQGVERIQDGVLDIVCIELSVVDSIPVAHPPTKEGFILTTTQPVVWNNSIRQVHYNGPKKPQSEWYVRHWVEPIEQATVFPSETAAEARLDAMIVEATDKVTDAAQALKAVEDDQAGRALQPHFSSYARAADKERLERAKQQHEQAVALHKWLTEAQIVPTS